MPKLTVESVQKLNVELLQALTDRDIKIKLILKSADELKKDNERLADYCISLQEKLK